MARIDTLLDAYDDARTGAVSTGWVMLAGRQCGVGVDGSEARVWLADDTDQERTFNVNEYPSPHKFTEAVFDWAHGLESA